MAAPAAPPLEGIRVLDFGHVLAGPYCTRILADLGADAVKIESRRRPDNVGAARAPVGAAGRTDRTPTFRMINRNKRSLTIDLKTDSGRELATRLAAVADVAVENFSAGVMARLGLDYGHLAAVNPGIVYMSMSGFGHEGPRRDWASMNMNLQAYTGQMYANGNDGDPPLAIANSWADYVGGMHAAFAIVGALEERRRTGVGRNLDLSQFEAGVSLLGPMLQGAIGGEAPAVRLGNAGIDAAPQGCYRCAADQDRVDGPWCVIRVAGADAWARFIDALGDPAWAAEAAFSTHEARVANRVVLDTHVEAWTGARVASEVERVLGAARIDVAIVADARDICTSEDVDRAFHLDPAFDEIIPATRLPIHFGSRPVGFSPAPRLGEHNEAVLSDWLGMPDDEIRQLADEGILH